MSYCAYQPGAAYNSAPPLPPGTAAGSSFRTRYFQNVDPLPRPPQPRQAIRIESPRKQWREYMEGLDASMRATSIHHDEKPLPRLPHENRGYKSPYRLASVSSQPPLPNEYPAGADTYYASPAPACHNASHPALTERRPNPSIGHFVPYAQQSGPSTSRPLSSSARLLSSYPAVSARSSASHQTPPEVDLSIRPTTYPSCTVPFPIPTVSDTSHPLHSPERHPQAITTPPRKSFKPSFHPLSPPPFTHANSAPSPSSSLTKAEDQSQDQGKSRDDPIVVDDLQSTPRRRVKSAVEAGVDGSKVTVRTPQRKSDRAIKSPNASPVVGSGSPGQALKCAGTTRQGLPCKRLVKVAAPWIELASKGCEGEERISQLQERYCKDHAGQICSAEGFYRGSTWVRFDDWIPTNLSQQTQTILRLTMESVLTVGESPGFIYAYELRDLATDDLSFFKVGRTDNVPRRIGQWTTRCSSHTPSLRDIFPLVTEDIQVSSERPISFLPGATTGGTAGRPTCKAVKRLERLVHLELADRSPVARLLEACTDCGTVHREIFPLSRRLHGDRTYDELVREVICRWERYVADVCSNSV